jgi:hypothetical protein
MEISDVQYPRNKITDVKYIGYSDARNLRKKIMTQEARGGHTGLGFRTSINPSRLGTPCRLASPSAGSKQELVPFDKGAN